MGGELTKRELMRNETNSWVVDHEKNAFFISLKSPFTFSYRLTLYTTSHFRRVSDLSGILGWSGDGVDCLKQRLANFSQGVLFRNMHSQANNDNRISSNTIQFFPRPGTSS